MARLGAFSTRGARGGTSAPCSTPAGAMEPGVAVGQGVGGDRGGVQHAAGSAGAIIKNKHRAHRELR